MYQKSVLFASGIALFILCLPNRWLTLPCLAWFCLVPLLLVTCKLTAMKGFLVSWLFFMVSLSALLWFKVEDSQFFLAPWQLYFAAVLLVAVGAAGYAFVITIAEYIFLRQKKRLVFPLLLACNWVGFEYLLTIVPFGFPLSLAISQSSQDCLIQGAAWGGIHMVSFLVVLSNALVFLITFNVSRKQQLQLVTVFILIHSLNYTYGYTGSCHQPQKTALNLVLIQPAYSSLTSSLNKISNYLQKTNLDNLFLATQKALNKKPCGLVIWPEVALNREINNDAQLKKYLQKKIVQLGTRAFFIFGSLDAGYNTAYCFDGNGRQISFYQKNKLIPLSEDKIFKAGNSSQPLITKNNTKIGTMICFDALFPKISRKLAINGGENLLTLANCALFGESNWPLLHRAFFVYRCVENGRPGVYLNNNGNSLAVDSFGRQIVSTPPNKPATVFVKIFPAGHLTFYSQSGDLFAIGCLMLIGPLLIPTIYREVMIKREKLQKNI